jgi:hypothetical protein
MLFIIMSFQCFKFNIKFVSKLWKKMTHFNNIHFEYSKPSSNTQGNFLESPAFSETVLEEFNNM